MSMYSAEARAIIKLIVSDYAEKIVDLTVVKNWDDLNDQVDANEYILEATSIFDEAFSDEAVETANAVINEVNDWFICVAPAAQLTVEAACANSNWVA